LSQPGRFLGREARAVRRATGARRDEVLLRVAARIRKEEEEKEELSQRRQARKDGKADFPQEDSAFSGFARFAPWREFLVKSHSGSAQRCVPERNTCRTSPCAM